MAASDDRVVGEEYRTLDEVPVPAEVPHLHVRLGVDEGDAVFLDQAVEDLNVIGVRKGRHQVALVQVRELQVPPVDVGPADVDVLVRHAKGLDEVDACRTAASQRQHPLGHGAKYRLHRSNTCRNS